jgi:hypothetical protein
MLRGEGHREHDREAACRGECQGGGSVMLGGGRSEANDHGGRHEERIDRGKAPVDELLGLDPRRVRQAPQGWMHDQARGELAPGQQSSEHQRGVAQTVDLRDRS